MMKRIKEDVSKGIFKESYGDSETDDYIKKNSF